MAIGAKKITLPITNESTGTVSNVEYSFVQVDNTLATAGAAADAKKTGDELSDLKQDFNEYHPDLGSGYSAQLLSTVFIEDEVPYNFRTSGGSADIGDREYDEIVGVSMPVNQLVQNGNFESTTGWGAYKGSDLSVSGNVLTFTASSTGTYDVELVHDLARTVGHKALAMATTLAEVNSSVRIRQPILSSGVSLSAGVWTQVCTIKEIPSGEAAAVSLQYSTTSGKYIKVKNVMVFDLTLMLGTAIADYVYGLEQSTAGSGVTWLKHHFPKVFDSGYIPYNAGEMQSVSGLSLHRMTGFNQWDEVWETGFISTSTGGNQNANDAIRSKNYIRIVGGASYHISTAYTAYNQRPYLHWYDAEKNHLGYAYAEYGHNELTATAPANAWYTRFAVANLPTPVTYNHDICINLHWDGERDGEYEEYKEYEYALDDSVTLRGILKLDSSNSLYADGDRYLPSGEKNERFGEVDLGTIDWTYESGEAPYFRFTNPLLDMKKPLGAELGNFVSDGYVADTFNNWFANRTINKTACIGSDGRMYLTNTAYTDATTFKTAMSGVKLVYEKVTATTETAEPYQTPQIVDDWGTEEYVSTSLVPVGHDTKYANNLRAKLEMSPDSPEEDGDYIVRHNNGENEYVALGSTTTIQGILDRLTALENA